MSLLDRIKLNHKISDRIAKFGQADDFAEQAIERNRPREEENMLEEEAPIREGFPNYVYH